MELPNVSFFSFLFRLSLFKKFGFLVKMVLEIPTDYRNVATYYLFAGTLNFDKKHRAHDIIYQSFKHDKTI